MICGPNLSKLSAQTLESTESSPPGWPCCSRQLRSGNSQPMIALKTAMPSSSAAFGPAMPSSDIAMLSTTLLMSGSFRPGRLVRPPGPGSERTGKSLRRGGTLFLAGQPGRAAGQVPALGEAGRAAGGLPVARHRARDIAGHLQQMRPGRVQPVMARHPAVGFQLAEQVKPGLRAGHHRDRDRPVEADYRARCELPEQIVEAEYLRPVGGADGLRLVMHRGDRGLHLVRADLTCWEHGADQRHP